MTQIKNNINTYADLTAFNADTNKDFPNISFIVASDEVKWNKYDPDHIVAVYNVTSTSDATKLLNTNGGLNYQIIDGVRQDTIQMNYTFDTLGKHIVKYKINGTNVGNIFEGCTSLISATIPEGITYIRERLFNDCTNLTSIIIPNSVTSMDINAFYNCPVQELYEGLYYVGDYIVGAYYQKLTTYAIKDNTKLMCKRLFNGKDTTTKIILNNRITKLDDYTFFNCSGLTSVGTVGSGASLEIPNNITTISNNVFQNCTGLTSVTIPESVTSIGTYVFGGCTGLTSITFEATTPPTLSSGAFDNTNNCPIYVPAESVNAYKAAQYWSTYADRIQTTQILSKYNVTSTESATNLLNTNSGMSYQIIDGVQQDTVQTTYTFDTLGEHTVIYKLSGTSIVENAFEFCSSLKSVTIPNTVTTIGGRAFYVCSGLTSVEIANGVTSIGNNAFSTCSNLTTVTIPSSVTTIGNNVFFNCSHLTSITIPSSVTSIGTGVFSGCSGLTSVTFESGSQLTSISQSAFYGCSHLTSINIPSSVTNIADYVFSNCTGLTSITIQATTPPTLGNSALNGTNANLVIYVPDASVAAYKAAANWSSYAAQIQAIPSV